MVELENFGISVILPLMGAIISMLVSLYFKSIVEKVRKQKLTITLQDNIEKLVEKFREARELQGVIDAQIGAQFKSTEKMSKEYSSMKNELSRMKKLKELSHGQVEAIGDVLKKEMVVVSRESFYKNTAFSITMFFLGAIVTIVVQILLP